MQTPILRVDSSPRLSRVVVHNSTVYLSGITATARTDDVAQQTADVLSKIDHYLAEAGTDRSRILYAQIWLRDITRDFTNMDAVWQEWLAQGPPPARATAEAFLASPDILVEIVVTAALPG
jgi:enamine deaminase RidA (YjgF/YER057c/UK114 family)